MNRWILRVALLALLVPTSMPMLAALAAQEGSVKQDLKDAGRDTKHAAHKTGEATEHATKKTGHAVKKNTKKGIHESAKKVRHGAERVEEKTEPHP